MIQITKVCQLSLQKTMPSFTAHQTTYSSEALMNTIRAPRAPAGTLVSPRRSSSTHVSLLITCTYRQSMIVSEVFYRQQHLLSFHSPLLQSISVSDNGASKSSYVSWKNDESISKGGEKTCSRDSSTSRNVLCAPEPVEPMLVADSSPFALFT